ncbi:hypothetical protein F4809DRAFT_70081 [Biscogniauxia mediterranea]|nr:hypothetical protein F4809DRAFT_70081 [Biscogniauxia mediterranea]
MFQVIRVPDTTLKTQFLQFHQPVDLPDLTFHQLALPRLKMALRLRGMAGSCRQLTRQTVTVTRNWGPSYRHYSQARPWHTRTLATVTDRAPISDRPTVSSLPGFLNFQYNNRDVDVKRTKLPNLWLRACVNQDTMQRNFNSFELPELIQPLRIETNQKGVKIHWSETTSHESFYPWDFLEHYLKFDKRSPEEVEVKYFGAYGHLDSFVKSEEIASNETAAVGRLTDLIRRNGFAFITGVPFATAEPTQRLAHTDTTYFTDPAGLQALHLLSHVGPETKNGLGATLGGKSLLVDGFYAAGLLKAEDPQAYDILSSVKLPWHASGNKGITISPDNLYPVFENNEVTGKLHRIRWNNDDRGVVPFDGKYTPWEWYDAAKKKSVEYWFQLRPGEILIFDNWRVLHGRSAFTGVRRMCGGYINRDDFISRWRNTNYARDDILKRVIG